LSALRRTPRQSVLLLFESRRREMYTFVAVLFMLLIFFLIAIARIEEEP
jgi:hypothetical protein